MTWIAAFNGFCSALYDALVGVARPVGEMGQLVLVGLVLGAVVAIVFKKLIDLDRLRSAQRRLLAALYESWLYRHQPVVVLRANWVLLRANLAYLRAFFWPLLAGSLLATPLVLQAYHHFGLRNLEPGDTVLLTAELTSLADIDDPVAVRFGTGRGAIAPPVRQPARSRIVWRVTPEAGQAATLRLEQGRERLELPLGLAGSSVSTGLYRSAGELLLAPRAGVLAAESRFSRIWVDYDLAPADWLGWLTLGSLGGAALAHWGMEGVRRRAAREPLSG